MPETVKFISNPAIESVRNIGPIGSHPRPKDIISIYLLAKSQHKERTKAVKGSNEKALLTRDNLTPEQVYIYEWITYIFTVLGVPPEVFARQVGVTRQMLGAWLGRRGWLPSRPHFKRIMEIYDTNFRDELALNALHAKKIEEIKRKPESFEEFLENQWF